MNTQKIAERLPKWMLPTVRKIYCYYQKYSTIFYSFNERVKYIPIKNKKRILIYGVSALSFGGTEKNLQIIAKYLDKNKYDVYFMYWTKPRKLWNYNQEMIKERLEYVKQWWDITFIPFDYSNLEEKHPYIIRNMTPYIRDVIQYYSIDLVIAAWAWNAEYPLMEFTNPIIFLNIFWIPNLIKNIRYHLCISNTVWDMISDIVPRDKIKTFYIPSEWPIEGSKDNGMELRKKLWFDDADIVFWRIWRADDSIFDPIWILAFERIVKNYQNVHYLIVSPAPRLREIVKNNNIKNIHFMDPIYSEKDVWAFHSAIDVLAHFRHDGESCGLNIAESMLCGKPIITHRSKIWNAHLEYLTPENSFIADIDDINQYADALEFFAKDESGEERKRMWEKAKQVAEELFHINSYMSRFDELIQDSLHT